MSFNEHVNVSVIVSLFSVNKFCDGLQELVTVYITAVAITAVAIMEVDISATVTIAVICKVTVHSMDQCRLGPLTLILQCGNYNKPLIWLIELRLLSMKSSMIVI